MKLEAIKDQYAKERGFENWDDLLELSSKYEVTETDLPEIAKRYAKAVLEEAAEEKDGEIDKLAKEYAESENSCYSNDYYGFTRGYEKALESITNITLD